MKISPDYRVFRAWFDKRLSTDIPIFETPDYRPINLIAQYHILEEEFQNWANETGGSGKYFEFGFNFLNLIFEILIFFFNKLSNRISFVHVLQIIPQRY